MTKIGVSADLNCSANHVDDSFGQFYADTACGTLIVVNGTLFGPASIPAGSSASPRTAFTSVSQSLTTGSGTTADPYTMVTVVDAGSTGIRLTQTDSYVVGQESWRTDVEIANTTATDVSVRLYRAFDCYRADSDFGYGYADLASGTVACQSQQSDPTPLLQIAPITPGSRFYEAFYDQIWAKIGSQEAFPDTCRCDEHIDNGAGLSWDVSVPAGAAEVRSERITITQGTPVGGAIAPEETLGAGNACQLPTQCNRTGYPVNSATGNFWHSFADVAVPGRGPALALGRTYNSLDAGRDGPFGFGWASSYTMRLVSDSVAGTVTIHQENGAQVKFTDDGAGTYTAPPRVLGRLVRHGDGTFTFTRKKRQHFEFAADGRLTSIRDLNGYTTTLAYDASARLATVTDAVGRAFTFNYGPDGRVASVTDPVGRMVSYGYNTAGELVNVTDVAGGVTSFTYGAGHLLATMTDPRGGVVTNTYDTSGRVTIQQDPTGGVTSFEYTASGTTITDANGNVEAQTYVSGLLRSLTRGVGTVHAATWSFTYDQSTLGLASVEDPNGRTTTMTYDVDGNRTSTIDPLGRQTTVSFNAFNSPEVITDPSGVATSFVYDVNGNLLSISRPLAGTADTQTTTFTYGDTARPGDVTAMTDPTNRTWQLAYDANGNMTVMTDPAGAATKHSYNTIGWRTATVSPRGNATGADPAAHTTSYTHNAFGQVATATDPTGGVTSYTYDPNSNVVSVTDPDGNITGYTYDAADRPTVVTRADATTVRSGYDANGNVVTQTDAAANITSYAYDALNRVISSTDPLNRTTTFGYDPAGNQTSMIDPAGQTTTLAYDAADQLTGVTYSDGTTPAVSYGYDANGRRTTMADGTGTTTYTWDSLDRLVSTTNGAGRTVGYSYDLAGRITAITYPNANTVARSYDPVGRLASVTDWLTNTTTFSYDLDGNLIGESRPNSTTAAYSVDAAGRTMAIDHTGPQGVIASFDYTRTASGLLASTTTTGISAPAESYGYTPLDQLASVNTDTYNYDPADNITKLLDGTTQSYDAASQLTSLTRPDATTVTFGYDSRGNRTSGVGVDGNPAAYGYDQANRLTEVTQAGSDAAGILDAGVHHSVALRGDGTVWAWGYNNAGQLGDGTTTNRTSPVQAANLTAVTAVAAGGYHTLAVRSDGTAWAWGNGDAGELGNAANGDSAVPVQVAGLTGVDDVSGGSHHSLALRGDGTVWGWGSNAGGQVGDGSTTSRNTPVQVTGLTGATAIAAGGMSGWAGHSLAVRADGTVWAWGNNSAGQLGDGTTTQRNTPVQVQGLTGVVAVAADGDSSYALKADGTVWAWGANGSGQLANTTVKSKTATPVQSNITNVAFIAAGSEHAMAIKTDGTAWAWGNNENGQLGNGTSGRNAGTSTPIQIQTITNVSALAGGHRHSLGATDTGSAWAWGLNTLGQVGDGTTTTRTTPVAVNTLGNVEPGPSLHATYTYNGDGLRTAKTVNNTTTTFTWDHANGLPLLLDDGAHSYIYGPAGLPLAQIAADGTTDWFHQDQIGSTRALTDTTGTNVSTYEYDAYGNHTQQTGTTATMLGYTGEYTDAETGFIYLRARYYDPATSQFLTRDPIVGVTQDPYGYALNNPVNATDPTGLCGFLGDGPCTPGGVVDDIADRSPVRGQDVANVAAGVLSGLTVGNQDLLLPASAEDNYDPNNMAFQRGKLGGIALLTPFAVTHPVAVARYTTAGGLLDIGRTCIGGASSPACLGTSSAATVTHATGMIVGNVPVVGPGLTAFTSLFGSMWDSSWFESQYGC